MEKSLKNIMKVNINLVATVHDPGSRLIEHFERQAPKIKKFYNQIFIVATPETGKELINAIRKVGFACKVTKKNSIDITYKLAIFHFDKGPVQCTDLDRVLHWSEFYGAEFKRAILKVPNYDFLLFERTARAHKTHHSALYETEKEANAIISKKLGISYKDFFAGSVGMSEAARKFIKSIEMGPGWAFLVRFPVKIMEAGMSLGFYKCEGLEWETPDRFKMEIKAVGGLAKWRAAHSTLKEWKRRKKFKKEFLLGLNS